MEVEIRNVLTDKRIEIYKCNIIRVETLETYIRYILIGELPPHKWGGFEGDS